MNRTRLALAPIPYAWPRAQVYDFYRRACGWPVDIVYLGETVCSKRRELRTREWIALAREIAATGREVVLSTLALIETEAELAVLQRLAAAAGDGLGFEANDMAAVAVARAAGLPFVGGPTLNVYNPGTLVLLQTDGLRRLVLSPDQGRGRLAEWQATGCAMPELELQVWGRPALAHSARCFTARADGVSKDTCEVRCLAHAEGLPLATREGERFLVINGVQVQGGERTDLGPELAGLQAAGVSVLRLQPQPDGMEGVVERFAAAIRDGRTLPRAGAVDGWWLDSAGLVRT